MHTYTYHCKKCNHRFEKDMTLREHEEHKPIRCPKCNSKSVEQVPAHVDVMTSKKS